MNQPMNEHPLESHNNLYPDGRMAMESFDQAIKGIHENLQYLEPFLSKQILACDDIAASLENTGIHSVSQDTLLAMTASWDLYRKALITAILDISKVCDAIMIESTGAPGAFKRDIAVQSPSLQFSEPGSSSAVYWRVLLRKCERRFLGS